MSLTVTAESVHEYWLAVNAGESVLAFAGSLAEGASTKVLNIPQPGHLPIQPDVS